MRRQDNVTDVEDGREAAEVRLKYMDHNATRFGLGMTMQGRQASYIILGAIG